MSCHGSLPEVIDIILLVDNTTVYNRSSTFPESRVLEIMLDLPIGNSCSAKVTARNQFGSSLPRDIPLGNACMLIIICACIGNQCAYKLTAPCVSIHSIKIVKQAVVMVTTAKTVSLVILPIYIYS